MVKTQWGNWQRYFDAKSIKNAPKNTWIPPRIRFCIKKLFKHCYHGDWQDETWYKSKLDENQLSYPDSARKIQMMGKILQENDMFHLQVR